MSNELELIGFDGTMAIDCATYLPIVRQKQDDRIFKHSTRKQIEKPHRFYSQEEIKSLADERIITLLDKPMDISPDDIVIYFSNIFLDALGEELPTGIKSKSIGNGVIISLNNADEQQFLDEYATILMNKATSEMISFLSDTSQTINHENASHYINLSRQASVSKEIRAKIFLRYGVIEKYSLYPEKLENIFQLRIKKQFTSWTWERFQLQVNQLVENLHIQAASRKFHSQDQLRTTYLLATVNELLCEVTGIPNNEVHLKCVRLAENFRGYNPISSEKIQKIAIDLFNKDYIRLNVETLYIFAGEPAFYYWFSRMKHPERMDTRNLISSVNFRSAAEELKNNNVDPGILANNLFNLNKGIPEKNKSLWQEYMTEV